MQVNVRVIPKARRVRVSEEDGCLRVHLTKPAHEGRANEQLRDVLSEYFKVKRYRIRIVRGEASRSKLVEIADE